MDKRMLVPPAHSTVSNEIERIASGEWNRCKSLADALTTRPSKKLDLPSVVLTPSQFPHRGA